MLTSTLGAMPASVVVPALAFALVALLTRLCDHVRSLREPTEPDADTVLRALVRHVRGRLRIG